VGGVELSFDMENQIKKMKDILDRNELLELVGESVVRSVSRTVPVLRMSALLLIY
jgi:hypothetical protein